jgi:hypothetical protein
MGSLEVRIGRPRIRISLVGRIRSGLKRGRVAFLALVLMGQLGLCGCWGFD